MCVHFAFCNKITVLKNALKAFFMIVTQLFPFVYQNASRIICSKINEVFFAAYHISQP
jgi:hypothetical protein